MPNWVSNTVTPLNEAAVSFTRERIVDEKGEFCFGRLVPLPRELSKPVLRTESFPPRKCRPSRNGMQSVSARSMSRKDCCMLNIRPASSKAAVPPSVPEISSNDSEPQTGTPSQTAIGAANGMPAAENMTTPATSSIRPGAILRRLRKSWPHHALKATGNGDGKKNRASAESLRSGTESSFTPILGISRKRTNPMPIGKRTVSS